MKSFLPKLIFPLGLSNSDKHCHTSQSPAGSSHSCLRLETVSTNKEIVGIRFNCSSVKLFVTHLQAKHIDSWKRLFLETKAGIVIPIQGSARSSVSADYTGPFQRKRKEIQASHSMQAH